MADGLMPDFLFIGLGFLIAAALLAGAAVIGLILYIFLRLTPDEDWVDVRPERRS